MEKTNYSLADFGVNKQEGVLRNGLRVVFIRKPFAPISMSMMIRAGSVFDPKGKEGLAHFTEHLLMNGSTTMTQKDFWGIAAAIGAYANAKTSTTYMSVDLEIAIPEHLVQAQEYFSHALSEFHVTDEILEKERNIIISEITGKESKNSLYKPLLLVDDYFANHTSWGTPTLGTIESVQSITVQDVINFFTKHCTVENMVLVIAGGCEWSDIEARFSTIPFLHGTQQELPPDPPIVSPGTVLAFEAAITQTSIVFGFLRPELWSREDNLLGFAFSYSHDGMTSLFKQYLREERGLAYGLKKSFFVYNNLGYIGTEMGTPCDRIDDALEALQQRYISFIDRGIAQEEIVKKAATMWFSNKRGFQESSDWVEIFDTDLLYPVKSCLGEFPDIHNYRKTYTEREIKEVLEKTLVLQNRYLILVGQNVTQYA